MNKPFLLLAFIAFFGVSCQKKEAPIRPEAKVVYELIERIIPGYSNQFIIKVIPNENNQDVYEITSDDNKIVLKGNNPVSVAVALNQYLKYECNVHFSWSGNQVNLPEKLPIPKNNIKEIIQQKHRVYFNYCTMSYSAPWWDWDRWQQEIDFMALNGINMPLSVIGIEGVWYNTLEKFGFSDTEIRSFLVGPAFQAWQWMTNIENHPTKGLPKSWIDSHVALGKKIMDRQLELGMTPIQQGFSGFVPIALAEKYPNANIQIKKRWANAGYPNGGFPGTAQLDPTDPLFNELGSVFFDEQQKLFGLHHFYAADPFHEGHPPIETPEYLNKVGKSIEALMQSKDTASTWVMQAWSIRKDIATAVSKDKLLVLDLNGTKYKSSENYWGYPFVLGNLHNFGGRINIHGDIGQLAENQFTKTKKSTPNVIGTGLFMEGIDQNPLYYDLAFEVGTFKDTINLNQWLKHYAQRRYGTSSESAAEACNLLWKTAYTTGTNGVEKSSIICARPAVDVKKSGPNAGFHIPYNNKDLLEALKLLMQDHTVLGNSTTYRYDIVDILRQCLSNYGQILNKKAAEAFKAKDEQQFKIYSQAFLELLKDVDALLATREEFQLSKWVNDAKSWGTTPEEKAYYAENARMLVTVWGPEETQGDNTLYDYAWREWSGLIGSFYHKRWEMFYDMLSEKLKNNENYNEDNLPRVWGREAFRPNSFYNQLADFEWNWVKTDKAYPKAVSKNEIKTVKTLMEKYGKQITDES